MSSRKVHSIDAGAIISANDVRTGRTVYFNRSGEWSTELNRAVLIKNDGDAAIKLSHASAHDDVVGAALIKTNEQGKPLHIRELIRALGPSIASDAKTAAYAAGGSRVSI